MLFAGLLPFAFFVTQFLLDASPWSMVPVTFYGWHSVAHVAPLPFFMRVLASVLAIRLAPIIASVAISRRLSPSRIAALGALATLGLATLAYWESRQFPAAPYVFALFVLDLALAISFATPTIEALNVGRAKMQVLP